METDGDYFGLGGCCIAHSLLLQCICLLVIDSLLLPPQKIMHQFILNIYSAWFLWVSELKFKSYYYFFFFSLFLFYLGLRLLLIVPIGLLFPDPFLDLLCLQYNDNSGNSYSDVFLVAALVQSVGELEFSQQVYDPIHFNDVA